MALTLRLDDDWKIVVNFGSMDGFYKNLKHGYAHSKTGMPGFHMIVLVVPANDPDDWDNLDPLDRVEFYLDDHVNFEAIIWKCSQTTETIGTIEGYPTNVHSYSSIQE